VGTTDETLRGTQEWAIDDDPFRLLVESVRDYAIFILDPRGHVVTWNLGAERFKGYRADEILGRHFSIFYPPDDVAAGKPERELVEAAREGRLEDEGWRVRKDGSRFWANVVITPLRRSDGKLRGFAKVTRDLTARREAERTALALAAEQAARRAAEKAETFERHMVAIVGHDLRNSLSVVLTAAEMIRLHGDADRDALRRHIGRILRGGRRMHEIVRTLVDYAHAQRPDGIPIEPRDDADIHRACERVIQEAAALWPARVVSYEGEGTAIGCWDEPRLEQVVQNLLGNALKYGSPDSPVTVRWWRTGDEARGGGDLVLTVHNHGAPISEELLPHVFDAYCRGDVTPSAAKESLGLGLFIVREIVRAHGGAVDVVSSGDAGTTFTVTLPERAPARPGRPAPREREERRGHQ
jgi:PAS domain S-box-containing protein